MNDFDFDMMGSEVEPTDDELDLPDDEDEDFEDDEDEDSSDDEEDLSSPATQQEEDE